VPRRNARCTDRKPNHPAISVADSCSAGGARFPRTKNDYDYFLPNITNLPSCVTKITTLAGKIRQT
jgi:hypothetical protein